MLRQAYRVTGGFRKLPGKGITSVEDAEALAKLRNDFAGRFLTNSPGTITVTPEARAALDRLGLTRVDEKTINRMLSKYHNSEAVNRARNIRYMRIADDPINSVNQTRTHRKLLRRGQEGVDFQTEMSNDIKSNHLFLSKTKEESSEPIARFMRKKLGVSTYRLPDDKVGGKIHHDASDLTKEEIMDLPRLKDKKSHIQNVNYLEQSYRNSSPLLIVNPKSKRVIALHEWGHWMNRKKGLENINLKFDPNNPSVPGQFITNLNNLGELAEENMASARALEALKNQGKREQDLGRISVNKALGTYIGNARVDSVVYRHKYPNS